MIKIVPPKILLMRLSLLCLIVTALVLVLLIAVLLFSGMEMPADQARNLLVGSLLFSVAICGFALLAFIGLRTALSRKFQEQEAQMLAGERSDALALAASQRAEQLSGLAQHLMRVAEEEKSKLAGELHGGLAACFTVLTMDLSMLAEQIKHSDASTASRIQRIVVVVRDALDLERRIVENLRPSMLEALGLPLVLEVYVNEFARSSGLGLTLDIKAELGQLNYECAIGLFRIAQLALTNIAQHAHATTICLSLYAEANDIALCVADDGTGVAFDTLEKPDSYGLIEMRERVAQLGGEFSCKTNAQNTGNEQMKTAIEVRIPLHLALVQ